MLVIMEIKISLVCIKWFLYQCHSPYARQVSSHSVLYLQYLGSYNIRIIYLHVIEACLKVTIVIFFSFHSKNPSNIVKNIFNSISIYSWNKIYLLANTRNKCFMRKINLYFLTIWKFLFCREMENIRTCKEIRLQKLIKFRSSE